MAARVADRPALVAAAAAVAVVVLVATAVFATRVVTGGDAGAGSPETPHWRPTAHLAPARNWMNDPNGLVYLDGVYHAFYQYNPKSSDWGNMSWGHSTSTDLVTWTEHPVALPAT